VANLIIFISKKDKKIHKITFFFIFLKKESPICENSLPKKTLIDTYLGGGGIF
jgi:hypothetical protein